MSLVAHSPNTTATYGSQGTVESTISHQQIIEQLNIGKLAQAELNEVLSNLPDQSQRNELLQSLIDIMKAERADGLGSLSKRQELAEGLIRDLHNPFDISQSDKATCQVVAGILMKLAYEQPAEYARLLEQVTSDTQEARLRSGEQMKFLQDSVAVATASPGAGIRERSLTQRILQTSLMHSAAQMADKNYVYLPREDRVADLNGGPGLVGLDPHMYQRLRNAVFENGSQRLDVGVSANSSTLTAQQVLDRAQEGLMQGRSLVVAEVRWTQGGMHDNHCVAIHKIENGRVYFVHGWSRFDSVEDGHHFHLDNNLGKLESMPVEKFLKRLTSIYLENAFMHSDANGQPLLTAAPSFRLYTPGLTLATQEPTTAASLSRPTEQPQIFSIRQNVDIQQDRVTLPQRSSINVQFAGNTYIHPGVLPMRLDCAYDNSMHAAKPLPQIDGNYRDRWRSKWEEELLALAS